jgi:hypothetical protein
MNKIEILLELITDFYENHSILFEIIIIPFELIIGITLAFLIMNLIGWV